jgi:cell division topological specificity factor
MSIFGIFGRQTSAPVARERLQILLAHERNSTCDSDLIAVLHKEILSAISKHISVDPDKVQVKMDRCDHVSILEIDVEIESPSLIPALKSDPRHPAQQTASSLK